jgi:hypothetical protein
MSGNIKIKDSKILCLKSGNRCALPNCRKELIVEAKNGDSPSLIAQMAHIKGEKSGSARYDKKMSNKDRNSYENLILLCPSCHKIIDDQPITYTAEYLHKIKEEHEAWNLSSTKREVINVSFSELDIVTKHLCGNNGIQSDSLTLIPPKDKINKNGLSNTTAQQILIGMTQVKQVSDFIDKMNAIDMKFTERLITGFVNEYNRLKNEEHETGDVLFDRLFDFSCKGLSDFKYRAAGLSVLVYLFERCEVFEK